MAYFKEIVTKISEEANVESALDLTLARDINEIIDQLKQAVDETTDETEDIIEKTEVVEELTTQILNTDELPLDTTIADDKTEYEDKFSSLGNPIYYVKVIK